MTKKERAIIIAKDVLRRLDSLNIRTGLYCEGLIPHDVPIEGEAQEYIKKIIPTCRECALGAFFLISTDRFDKCNLRDMIRWDEIYVTLPVIKNHLTHAFSLKTLALIEVAFEVDAHRSYAHNFDMTPAFNRAAAFGAQFKDNKRRLRAIAKNIVQNGTFQLPRAAQATAS